MTDIKTITKFLVEFHVRYTNRKTFTPVLNNITLSTVDIASEIKDIMLHQIPTDALNINIDYNILDEVQIEKYEIFENMFVEQYYDEISYTYEIQKIFNHGILLKHIDKDEMLLVTEAEIYSYFYKVF